MREAFSNALVRLTLADAKVLVLTGYQGYSLFDEFRKCCPDQSINAGMAAPNMVGMAAGLARVGFRAFVYVATLYNWRHNLRLQGEVVPPSAKDP